MTFKILSTFYGETFGDLVKAYPTLIADFGARYVDDNTAHIFIDSLAHLEYLKEKLMENNDKVTPRNIVRGLILGVEDGKQTIEIYDGWRE